MEQRKRVGRKFPNIAKLIRVARQNNGNISQLSLGHMLGYRANSKTVNSQFISNIERELCSVPAKKVKPLALALNLDIASIKEAMVKDFLLNLDNEIEKENAQLAKIRNSEENP